MFLNKQLDLMGVSAESYSATRMKTVLNACLWFVLLVLILFLKYRRYFLQIYINYAYRFSCFLVTIFNKIFAEALQMEDLFAIKDLLSESTRNVILNNYFGLTTQNGFENFLVVINNCSIFCFIILRFTSISRCIFCHTIFQ